jgi:hypothetical protein
MRPLTFWSLVAGVVFAAMTVLWAFGDEPTGVVFILATAMWWGSALALVTFGLVAIWRWRREPAPNSPGGTRPPAKPRTRPRRRRAPAVSRRSSPSSLD